MCIGPRWNNARSLSFFMSNSLLTQPNERIIIIGIRAVMTEQEHLAMRSEELHEGQWKAYIADIEAPNKPGNFATLGEFKTYLGQKFDLNSADLLAALKTADNFYADRGLPLSEAWSEVITELQTYGYLNNISALATTLRIRELPSKD